MNKYSKWVILAIFTVLMFMLQPVEAAEAITRTLKVATVPSPTPIVEAGNNIPYQVVSVVPSQIVSPTPAITKPPTVIIISPTISVAQPTVTPYTTPQLVSPTPTIEVHPYSTTQSVNTTVQGSTPTPHTVIHVYPLSPTPTAVGAGSVHSTNPPSSPSNNFVQNTYSSIIKPPLDFILHNSNKNYYQDYSISKETTNTLLITSLVLFLLGLFAIKGDLYRTFQNKFFSKL